MAKLFKLLYGTEGKIGRMEFMFAESFRGIALAGCYGLYLLGWKVLVATLIPFAVWPGIVGTIKRFRDLGHATIWILPVLSYLSFGFAAGYAFNQKAIGLVMLGIYLVYVLGVKGKETTEEAQ